MPIARVHKTKDFTVMSNYHFREKGMSLKAKGLLSLMLSLPDDWDYSIAGLVTLSKDGKDSVMGALNELERFGYLKRTRVTNAAGQFAGYDYDIFESPMSAEPESEKPQQEKPCAENPHTDKPHTENPQQLNTNLPSTKKPSTQEIKDIVSFLNDRAGKRFSASSKATQAHIHARMQEGFTVEDFKLVIAKKCDEWLGTGFEQYLRPATLFGTKFEGYLNAPAVKHRSYGATGVEIAEETRDEELDEIFS